MYSEHIPRGIGIFRGSPASSAMAGRSLRCLWRQVTVTWSHVTAPQRHTTPTSIAPTAPQQHPPHLDRTSIAPPGPPAPPLHIRYSHRHNPTPTLPIPSTT